MKKRENNNGTLILNEETEARATHLYQGYRKFHAGHVSFFINFELLKLTSPVLSSLDYLIFLISLNTAQNQCKDTLRLLLSCQEAWMEFLEVVLPGGNDLLWGIGDRRNL